MQCPIDYLAQTVLGFLKLPLPVVGRPVWITVLMVSSFDRLDSLASQRHHDADKKNAIYRHPTSGHIISSMTELVPELLIRQKAEGMQVSRNV